ncbi:unnamed protein product [Clavelina lepadiformis]|uniref:Uncharacterized protein n=1 Tax=Clavelina lepadiformis TaxID=159417 RepID=A0ABP0FMC9_CLALP
MRQTRRREEASDDKLPARQCIVGYIPNVPEVAKFGRSEFESLSSSVLYCFIVGRVQDPMQHWVRQAQSDPVSPAQIKNILPSRPYTSQHPHNPILGGQSAV